MNNFNEFLSPNKINTYGVNSSTNSFVKDPPQAPQVNLSTKNIPSLKDEFVKTKKNNGLIEKFYDFLKNKTGWGLGSKKIEHNIDEFEKGKISEEQAEKKISDYKTSQKNAAQNVGNLTSSAVGVSGFYYLYNLAKHTKTRLETEALPFGLSKIFKEINLKKANLKELEKVNKLKTANEPLWAKIVLKIILNAEPKLKSIVNSKTKTIAVIMPLIAVAGALTKYFTLKFNRIGSKEFKIENKKELNKSQLKEAKKEQKHKRHQSNRKNFYTGGLNALLAPITAIASGIVGVPAYILATTGINYSLNKNNNKKKSFNNFVENLKSNVIINTLCASAIAVLALKKAHYSPELGINLEKVGKALKGVKLQNPSGYTGQTSYEEIRDIMLRSPKITQILRNSSSDINQQIKDLTKENIFAVKLLQTSNEKQGWPMSEFGELISGLKENCPPSRSLDEAKLVVNNLMGTRYTLTKRLGVGTMAEAYLAKDTTGKEVCIKILKKGINAEKIQKNKEAFINLVTEGKPDSQLTNNQKNLVRNIENLAEGYLNEVNLENELKATQRLKACTKTVNVVEPIEAKPGIYVMEKAPGLSLENMVNYIQHQNKIRVLKQELKAGYRGAQSDIDEHKKAIEQIRAKSPDFGDFDLSGKEIKKLLTAFNDARIEQFSRISNGKQEIHLDLHSGNVVVDIKALKAGKKKFLTLIDMGNTASLTKEQAIRSIKLTSYIENGNTKDLTALVLDGAALPNGMTQEKARELVEHDLREIFFDNKTNIKSMNIDELFKLTDGILRKHLIVSNDTQLNLNKAKNAALESQKKLKNALLCNKISNMDLNKIDKSKTRIALSVFSLGTHEARLEARFQLAQSVREWRNMLHMGIKDYFKNKFNSNMLKTNSEEYLTYKLKQNMPNPDDNDEIFSRLLGF